MLQRFWMVGVIALATITAIVTGTGAAPASPHHHHLQAAAASATTRTNFIAADEVDWSDAPEGRNMITGEPFDTSRTSSWARAST